MRLPWRAREDRLLLRARRGEREAFRALYRELYEPVARFVGRRVQRREDAEDVISRTFERLLLRLESFDEEQGGALPFALAIARNLLVDDLRAQRPGVPLEEAAAQLIETRTPLAELLRGEEIRVARERLEALAPEVRELLLLRYADELSSLEIGQLLGIFVLQFAWLATLLALPRWIRMAVRAALALGPGQPPALFYFDALLFAATLLLTRYQTFLNLRYYVAAYPLLLVCAFAGLRELSPARLPRGSSPGLTSAGRSNSARPSGMSWVCLPRAVEWRSRNYGRTPRCCSRPTSAASRISRFMQNWCRRTSFRNSRMRSPPIRSSR